MVVIDKLARHLEMEHALFFVVGGFESQTAVIGNKQGHQGLAEKIFVASESLGQADKVAEIVFGLTVHANFFDESIRIECY